MRPPNFPPRSANAAKPIAKTDPAHRNIQRRDAIGDIEIYYAGFYYERALAKSLPGFCSCG